MELTAATILSISLVSLAILVSLLSRKSTPNSKEKRPPGPRCLPFIGSLLHLLTSQPQAALRDLAKKHGPVMYLRLGQVDTVVISSPAAAQEVLRDSTLTFASRPSLLATEIMCYGNTDMAFAPYGVYWRTMRKLCTVELLSSRKVRQFAPIRDSETMSLVRNVRLAGGDGRPVNLGKLLVSCANAIAAKATFGDGCDAGLQEQFLSAIDVGIKFSARGELDAVFGKIIAGCEARRQEKKTTGDDDDHLLSVMLRMKGEGGFELPITTTNIQAIIQDMFTGGTETTSSTVEWIMSELMRNPDVMARAQTEVRGTFENQSPQDHEALMNKLEYTRMVIKEGMRLHPALPLLLPRVCRETCEVGGFEVTAGSRVMVNAWAIARNPEYWGDDGDEFRPERFEGTATDHNGSHFEYLPFGSGRRMCPGSNFGLGMLELILARLLYYFNWSLPAGIRPHELDMDMVVSATARRRNPLHLVATPYNVPMEIS
ncbi:unnamed protein product [Alopecurus aequalis]